jgi:hypothetical protein
VKRVFFFGNGEAAGAGLAEMTALGIPVPPGFTIETGLCADFSHGASLEGVRAEVESALARVEHTTGKRFGDSEDPLLVSVRSGAPRTRGKAWIEAWDLRRARRRSAVDRVLPHCRTRLRLLLAFPGTNRPPGRGARGPRWPHASVSDRMTDVIRR